jgi:radical SAM protein with 4Fe4S-binding SPASM domain
MAHVRKQMISILLTTKCNMNCVYCITSSNFLQAPEGNIDLDFAQKGIDDYFRMTPYPYVRFVALGEPTENFSALQELHAYATERSNGKAQFELQTNGIFSEDKAEWIAEHIQTVWLSFDGLPDVHDRLKRTLNDKPTSAIILRNLAILRQKTFAGFRATITCLNVDRQCEMIEFAAKHSVPAMFTKVMLPPANPAVNHSFHAVARDLHVSIMDYAKQFVKAWAFSQTTDVFYGNGYINNSDEMCVYACRACLPCPHLTPDGFVSACDRATRGNTPLQEFIYGVWDQKKGEIIYDKKKIGELQKRSVENIPDCQDCKFKYGCAGSCLGTSAQLTGTMFKVDHEYCDAIRYMCEHVKRDPRQGLFPYFMT